MDIRFSGLFKNIQTCHWTSFPRTSCMQDHWVIHCVLNMCNIQISITAIFHLKQGQLCDIKIYVLVFFFQDAVKQLGGLDYLVLNHIILLDLGVWTGSPDNVTLIDRVFKVNFQSYVHLASHALSHLESTKGSILVVSSLAGKKTVLGCVDS